MQYSLSNNHAEAIPLLEKIVQQYPNSRPIEEKSYYIQLLCNSYIAVGRLNEAETIYLNTLDMLDNQGKQDATVYRNLCDALGVMYCELHNYQKGKDYSGRSKYLFEKNKDFGEGYILCLSNCAIAEQGLNHPYIAKLLIDVALKYMRQYDWKNAGEKITSGLQQVTEVTGGEIDADSVAKQSERMLKLRPYITLLSNATAINQPIGFWDDAVICMKESVALSEDIGEPNGLAYNNLAILYLAQNRIEETIPYLEKAIPLCKTDYEKNEIYFNYALTLWLLNSENCSTAAINASKELTRSIMDSFAFLSQEERANYYKNFEYYY